MTGPYSLVIYARSRRESISCQSLALFGLFAPKWNGVTLTGIATYQSETDGGFTFRAINEAAWGALIINDNTGDLLFWQDLNGGTGLANSQ